MNNESVDNQSRVVKLSYLAGVMDSDGSAMIHRFKSDTSPSGFHYSSRLHVEMADGGPVRRFHEMFGGVFYISNRKPLCKPGFIWKVIGQRAAEVAAQLIPFSHNERKRAALQCAVAFGNTILRNVPRQNGVPFDIQCRRALLWNRCRALNATGVNAHNQSPVDLAVIEAMKIETAQLSVSDE